jgi:hypothetical protein
MNSLLHWKGIVYQEYRSRWVMEEQQHWNQGWIRAEEYMFNDKWANN